MALPTTRILLRSPYFVNKEIALLTSIKVDLYIYTGTLDTDKPANPQYTLNATAFVNSNGNRYAEIDIAPYCRDYVDVTFDFDQNNPSNATWIEYDLYFTSELSDVFILDGSYKMIGLDGYNYPHEGYNNTLPERLLMSTDVLYLPSGNTTTIPVLQDYVTNVSLYTEAVLVGSEIPVQSTDLTLSSEESADVVYYADTFVSGEVVRTAKFTYGGGRPAQDVQIKYNDECRNDPVEVSFVNRYGVIQRAWFFGKSTQSLTTEKEMYKKNLLNGTGSYDVFKHQNDILNKNGKQRITCNTGFYPEDNNILWKELMLSEKVWLYTSEVKSLSTNFDSTNITMPVTLVSSSLDFKTTLDDKLINYTFVFEYSIDVINTIR